MITFIIATITVIGIIVIIIINCFCFIFVATSGEEGRRSIMKEIGLGKELGGSPQENVVKFIGCVTTQSKKAILYIFSCLLLEIYTYFFCFLFV